MAEITSEYDWNIWSQEDNELCLTAYELEKDRIGYYQTNGDDGHYHTLRFTFPENTKEIEYLLQDLAINHYPFTDYDTWSEHPATFNGTTPEAIQAFIDHLPAYIVRTIGEI